MMLYFSNENYDSPSQIYVKRSPTQRFTARKQTVQKCLRPIHINISDPTRPQKIAHDYLSFF